MGQSAAAAGPGRGREKAAEGGEGTPRRVARREGGAGEGREVGVRERQESRAQRPADPSVCAVFAVYRLFPFFYLLVNATKTQADFTSTSVWGSQDVRPQGTTSPPCSPMTADSDAGSSTPFQAGGRRGGATLLAIAAATVHGSSVSRGAVAFVVVIMIIMRAGHRAGGAVELRCSPLNPTNTPWA